MTLEKHKGLLLQVGGSFTKQPGFVVLDNTTRFKADLVHDYGTFPFPLKDEECLTVLVKQAVEKIDPRKTIEFFDELWRITKPDGQLVVHTPYAGSSVYWQDPLNCNGLTERTFMYFDPAIPDVYKLYAPKPWKIMPGFPCWQSNGFIEVIMVKRKEIVSA